MNILWLPNFLPYPLTNGGKVCIFNRLKYVAKKHNIYLLTQNCDDVNSDAYDELSQLCKKIILFSPRNKSRINLFYGSYNVSRVWNRKWSLEIEYFLQNYNIDIINVDQPMICVNILPFIKKYNIPVIVNQHNLEFLSVKSKLYLNESSVIRKVYSFIEGNLLEHWEKKLYKNKFISAYTFVSSIEYKYFSENLNIQNRPLLLSPIGTDLLSEPYVKEAHLKNIIFVASFDYYPNIQGAVWFVKEVLPIIIEKNKDVKVYFVGRNPSSKILNLKNKNIIITGTVKNIGEYYQKADVVIIPILSGGGVKTKLIEAGAYGIPVVSTSKGIEGTSYLPEIDLLQADDPTGFANACLSILDKPDNYLDMGKRMVEKTMYLYQWEHIGINYREFLEKINNDYVD